MRGVMAVSREGHVWQLTKMSRIKLTTQPCLSLPQRPWFTTNHQGWQNCRFLDTLQKALCNDIIQCLIFQIPSITICFVCHVFSSHHFHDNLLKQVNTEQVKIHPWNWNDSYSQGFSAAGVDSQASLQTECTGYHSISSDRASSSVRDTTPTVKQNSFPLWDPWWLTRPAHPSLTSKKVIASNSYGFLGNCTLLWPHFISSAKDFLQDIRICVPVGYIVRWGIRMFSERHR